METLVITIPDAKSTIVKKVLHSMGVLLPGQVSPEKGDYKKRLLNVSVWSEEDLKTVADSGHSFNDLKAEEW